MRSLLLVRFEGCRGQLRLGRLVTRSADRWLIEDLSAGYPGCFWGGVARQRIVGWFDGSHWHSVSWPSGR